MSGSRSVDLPQSPVLFLQSTLGVGHSPFELVA